MYHTMIITRDGYNMLKEELDYLWLIKRPLITEKVAWAASLETAARMPTTSTTRGFSGI